MVKHLQSRLAEKEKELQAKTVQTKKVKPFYKVSIRQHNNSNPEWKQEWYWEPVEAKYTSQAEIEIIYGLPTGSVSAYLAGKQKSLFSKKLWRNIDVERFFPAGD